MTEHSYTSAPYSSAADQPRPVVRAKDAYRLIIEHLHPPLLRLGYRRGRSKDFPWWWVSVGGHAVFISAQVDTKATDPYAGGGFRLEGERGGADPDGKLTGRALFFQLLEEQDSEILIAHQNDVITSLPQPPPSHVDSFPRFLQPQYLSYFQPQGCFDATKSWLRYRTAADIDGWMA